MHRGTHNLLWAQIKNISLWRQKKGRWRDAVKKNIGKHLDKETIKEIVSVGIEELSTADIHFENQVYHHVQNFLSYEQVSPES